MPENPATLVVVDVQRAFDDPVWGSRNNPDAETCVARLLESWRCASAPIIHIRHRNELKAGRFWDGGKGFLPKPEALELAGEPVLTKLVNSSFIGTKLLEMLVARGNVVVFAGITTDHCVSTSVRMSANYGFETVVVSDATATFERVGPDGRHWTAQQMHDAALASLHEEFATVVDTAAAVGFALASASAR